MSTNAPAHLLEAHEAAATKVAAVNGRLEDIGDQRAEILKHIEVLNASYTAACRDLAAGKIADPAQIKTQLELTQMRLAGLELIHAETVAESEPLVSEAQRAWAAVRAAEEAALEAELVAKLDNVNRAFDVAQAALNAAQHDVHVAVDELGSFRRQRQLEAEERRAGRRL